MKSAILVTCFLGTLVILSCSDKPVAPPTTSYPLVPCDTCENGFPLSFGDSIEQNFPRAWYIIRTAAQDPTKSLLIGEYRYKTKNGIFIQNQQTREINFIAAWGYALFKDGKRMVIQYPAWSGIGIYNIETKSMVKIADGEFTIPSLSLDEKYIYVDSAYLVYRISIDGLKKEAISDSLSEAVQLDQSQLIGLSRYTIPREGLKTFNLETKKIEYLDFPELSFPINWGNSYSNWSLSPDKSKILMNIASEGGIWDRENGGLYVLNIASRSAKKVLPKQYWGQPYYPTWTSNTTFFASYHCRKDTTAMLFEYDLNGKVLRQVTFKEMKLYP